MLRAVLVLLGVVTLIMVVTTGVILFFVVNGNKEQGNTLLIPGDEKVVLGDGLLLDNNLDTPMIKNLKVSLSEDSVEKGDETVIHWEFSGDVPDDASIGFFLQRNILDDEEVGSLGFIGPLTPQAENITSNTGDFVWKNNEVYFGLEKYETDEFFMEHLIPPEKVGVYLGEYVIEAVIYSAPNSKLIDSSYNGRIDYPTVKQNELIQGFKSLRAKSQPFSIKDGIDMVPVIEN